MKRDSIFWIASMTKPITSVAAMILGEDGKLDLDAPVAQYLSELKDMQVGVEETDPVTGKMEIKRIPPERPMTVRDLLRHTSGLVYPPQFVDAPINRLYSRAHFGGDNTLAEFVASLADLPLAHQPGKVWEYSWGVDVLARVVEVASNQPFDQFLEKRIFGPLHMADTGFYVPEAKVGRLVEAPEPRIPQFDVTRPRKLLSGGGGLVSTAADYLRFCQMLLNGGERDGVRILSAKTVQEMTTNSLPPGIRFVGNAIGPSLGSSWGLGFAIRTDPTSSNVPGSVGSYAWGGVWGTSFWIDPAERLIAVQMIQVAPGKSGADFHAAIRNLTYGSLRVSEQSSSVSPASPGVVRPDMLADYQGKYEFGSSSSSRDELNSPASSYVGVGMGVAIADGGVKVNGVFEDEPAANAGVKVGDIITEIDDVPVKGFTIGQLIDKLHGAINSQVRLKILRPGVDHRIDIVVTRATVHHPAVALKVQIDAGKLMVEAIGTWPILDFEKGKPVVLTAASHDEFFVDSDDHTRIAFVRDATGKVSGAILNPGSREQRGERY
jgi:CubicO group peptidase (beta-lactamase class C family)